MLSEERITLSKLRFEKARECLSDAALLAENESYKSLANRSYYAVFHAIRAVLALDGFDSKKHSGVIADFRSNTSKTELLTKNCLQSYEDCFLPVTTVIMMTFLSLQKMMQSSSITMPVCFLMKSRNF